MYSAITTVLAVLLASSSSVRGVAIYGQCGGQGFAGSTVCDSGLSCVVLNDFYSQCLAATTSAAASSTASATTKVAASSTTSATGSASSVKYWFSFGDSYTQTGFDVTSTLPSTSNPLGNPTYPGYTACGSYTNWIDLDTVTDNGSNTVLTYNFAYGGATIDRTLVPPYETTVKTMTDQVTQFLSTVGTKPSTAPWASANSLFSFFIGINDIGNTYYASGDRSAFSDTLLNAYFALVQKTYAAGGRNFLFFTVPGVDRSPLMIAQGATAQALEKSVIDTFNTKLKAKVAAFKASNSGVSTYIYDANAKLVQILNSPTSYGFKDSTSYGSDTNEAWCNNYHISPGVHAFYATEIAALLKSGGFFT